MELVTMDINNNSDADGEARTVKPISFSLPPPKEHYNHKTYFKQIRRKRDADVNDAIAVIARPLFYKPFTNLHHRRESGGGLQTRFKWAKSSILLHSKKSRDFREFE
jgi:hypothetical protein